MRKENYKKTKRLKNVGTATALTITLATSNVPTLAYAMELENDIKEEVAVEEMVVEEVVVEENEEENKKKNKKKVTTQEEISSKEEVVTKEKEQELNIQMQEVNNQEELQSTVKNFDLNNWQCRVFNSTNTIVLDKYIGSNTDIVIPGEFEGKAIKIASVSCFSEIKPNLTSIEFKMENNKKVQTPSSLSTLFNTCKNLKSVDLSGLDTSTVNNMSYMFKDCSSLTNITFGDEFNTSNVTSMHQMFRECSSLTTLNLSNFETENVTDMSYMFDGCKSLETLNLSDFNTSGLQKIQDAFKGCTSLKRINLSNIKDVEFISNIFTKCTSLEEVNLSGADLSSLTSLNSIFANCKITKVDLSKADLSGLAHFQNIFQKHTSLEQVILRETNIPVGIKSMSQMFKGLTELKKVDLTGTNFSNVITIQEMFKECTSLEEVNLSGVNATALTNVKSLFEGCSALTSLNLEGSNIEFVENTDTDKNGNKLPTNMDNIFKNCSSLTNLNLSNFNTSNVTTMRSVFEGCKALTSLDLSSFNTGNVDNMNNMFKDCTNLNEITFGDNFKTENVTSMAYMFSDSGIKSLDLSSFDTQKVTDMSGMFRNTENLDSIIFYNELNTLFNTSAVKNMSYMFSGSSVKSLDLSIFNTKSVTKTNAMFALLDNINVLDLSSFNLDNVIEKQSMFGNNITVDYATGKIEPNPSPTAKELLVIADDNTLKSYDYALDACLPVGLTLDATGGQFENGKDVLELKTSVVERMLDEAIIDAIIEEILKDVKIPTKDGHNFISWGVTQPTRLNSSIFNKINATYYAEWEGIPTTLPDDAPIEPDTSIDPDGFKPVIPPTEDVPVEDEEHSSIEDIVNEGGVGSAYNPVNLIVNTLKGLEQVLSSIVNSGSHISLFRLEDPTTDKNIVVYKLHVIDGNSSYYIDIKVGSNANELTNLLNKIPKKNDGEENKGDENQEDNNGNSSTINPGNENSSNESTLNSGSNNNPQTGDTGVLGYIGLGLTSILGIFINNRKKKK